MPWASESSPVRDMPLDNTGKQVCPWHPCDQFPITYFRRIQGQALAHDDLLEASARQFAVANVDRLRDAASIDA